MSEFYNFLGTLSRNPGFGFGWSQINIFDFDGIISLQIVDGGSLKAKWNADNEADFYRIYVRANNSDVFHAEYSLGKVNVDILEAKFRTLADHATLLNSMDMIYAGVRAVDINGEEDTNTAVVYIRPATLGDNVYIDDSHISLLT